MTNAVAEPVVTTAGAPTGHDHALAHTEDASYRLSTAAAWAVSACAVHCIVTPLAAGVLPLVGIGVFASPWFEWTLVAIAALLGGLGFGLSFARVHRNSAPVAIFLAGLAVLAATHVFLEGHPVAHASAAVTGALIILGAGRLNHTLVHACERCHPNC